VIFIGGYPTMAKQARRTKNLTNVDQVAVHSKDNSNNAGDRMFVLNRRACGHVQQGNYERARPIYNRLATTTNSADMRLRALIHNDLAVLDVIEGRHDDARRIWAKALQADGGCLQAALNRDLFEAEMSLLNAQSDQASLNLELVPDPRAPRESSHSAAHQEVRPHKSPRPAGGKRVPEGRVRGNSDESPIRVAILSFLFN
jgi:hypothetical protein